MLSVLLTAFSKSPSSISISTAPLPCNLHPRGRLRIQWVHSTFVLTLLTHTIPLLSKWYIQHLLVMLMMTFEILSYCLIVLSSICHSNCKPPSSLSTALVLNTSPHLNVSLSIFSMETVLVVLDLHAMLFHSCIHQNSWVVDYLTIHIS